MTIQIQAPSMGESISEATVAKWAKSEGDFVQEDELVAELETDKVNLEVTAPKAGKLVKIVTAEGATVAVGDLMGEIDESGAAAETAAPAVESAPAAPVADSTGGGEEVTVSAPAMGESISEAVVAKWIKAEGDAVAVDELLAELETDKVNLEVMAPAAGTLAKILTPEGATVQVGEAMAKISAGAGAPAVATQAATATSVVATTATEGAVMAEGDFAPLSPAVQKMVEENGLDPSQIVGTGKGGRLTKADVIEFMARQTVEGQSAAAPGIPGAGSAPVAPAPAASSPSVPTPKSVPGNTEAAAGQLEERVKMSNLRKTVAKRLKDAQNNAAMLTTYNEIDLSEVMQLRKLYKEKFKEQYGVGLGFMSFFTKAVTEALREWPALNAEIQDEEIVYKKYYNIGVAVSTDKGLMVPVVRDADKMNFAQIEQAIMDYAIKAREGKISMDDMQGGTFTITNGGVFGSMMSMPILNYPQVGILGMHAIKERPVVINGEVTVRPMMYVALSYDHRIVDGREAVSFLVKVKECLEEPAKLMLSI